MAVSATMDFFQHQEAAKRRTSLLIFYYLLAVVLIMIGIYFAFALSFIGVQAHQHAKFSMAQLWNPSLFMWVVTGTALVVLGGTSFKISQLSGGGVSVAEMLGGRPISRSSTDSDERKVLNVVEEMAIASGTPVPPVYLLDHEEGINAFAAGTTPSNAVIGVTRGCIRNLTRDELQGVIAHEFSHIMNGDMRLNIRLIGVLNGILVISILGYWVFRTTLYSSGGSRSKDKGGKIPIVVLGLLVMIIGYIGVFFGKLIKSAVSRQREFLADASAVQFTRNPDGISGALKRIGNFKRGSKLASPNSEQASHMLFSNGLSSSFINLMATHPPLEERIKRLDPAFLSDLQDTGGLTSTVSGMAEAGAVSGFAGASTDISTHEVSSKKVVSTVGSLTPQHLDYAQEMLNRIPEPLRNALREPFGARAVVYCLLLNDDDEPRAIQMKRLSEHADAPVLDQTKILIPLISDLGAELRLPLLDIAVPALKDLSKSQFVAFKENVNCLVNADNQIDLFEFTLQRMILRHLDPVFADVKPPAVEYNSIEPLEQNCALLLSCLAYWGADDVKDAEKAFSAAKKEISSQNLLSLQPVDTAGLSAVDEALGMLASASPSIKKQVLTASVTCIACDGKITIEEAELIRVIADSLDCPIPPFIPGQKV